MVTAAVPSDFTLRFSAAMLERIGHLKVPDVPEPVLAAFKVNLTAGWSDVVLRGVVHFKGPDSQVRKIGVVLQGLVEEVLATGLVRSAHSIILTPTPSTPLCINRNGSGVEGVVTPEIMADPLLRLTAVLRARTVRDLLGPRADLVAAYPKNGTQSRTAQQLQIYRRAVADHAPYLKDRPLLVAGIPDRLVGAVYVMKAHGGREFAFGIKMDQDNAVPQVWNYTLAFKPMDDKDMRAWVDEVKEFVKQYSNSTAQELS